MCEPPHTYIIQRRQRRTSICCAARSSYHTQRQHSVPFIDVRGAFRQDVPGAGERHDQPAGLFHFTNTFHKVKTDITRAFQTSPPLSRFLYPPTTEQTAALPSHPLHTIKFPTPKNLLSNPPPCHLVGWTTSDPPPLPSVPSPFSLPPQYTHLPAAFVRQNKPQTLFHLDCLPGLSHHPTPPCVLSCCPLTV